MLNFNERRTEDFIYRSSQNEYGKSKDYEIFSVEEDNNRFARVVKVYRYDAYAGGMVPADSWRVDFGRNLNYFKSKVSDYNRAMKMARNYIKKGKV
jgi:hypothetical protein